MEEVIIRRYAQRDRDFVREISWETAFMGKPASIFFEDKELLADFLTLYFTDYEPGSCFVAEINGKVIGYLIGTKDTAILKKVFDFKISWRLFLSIFTKGVPFKKKNIIFFWHCGMSFFKGEFRLPDFSRNYPATLHINLDEGLRGLGIGSRLMNTYLEYLTQEKIPGVYLATISEGSRPFFFKQGFHLVYRGHRSYFHYLLKKDIPIYIFGKKLF
jgi:GNAT superfamily N-acetyltransferase